MTGQASGSHYWRLCRGLDPRPVVPSSTVKSVSHETTFEHDLSDRDELRRVLMMLAESVGRRLRAHDAKGRTVRLKIRFPPFETHSRQERLSEATWDEVVVFRRGAALLDAARRGRPVRLLGIGVTDLQFTSETPAGTQATLFPELDERPAQTDRLLETLDAIRDRFGEAAVRRGRSESRSRRA